MKIINLLNRFLRDPEGQTLTEYAIIGLLVLLAVIVVLTILGESLSALFENFITTAFGP